MNHLKKVANNITSKLGLLNTHRTLVMAISEEQKVYENMIKLVLDRVNGKRFNKNMSSLSVKVILQKPAN